MSSDRDYVLSGSPYRRSDGKVFQNGSELSLHRGFWWWDVGCAVAPEGCEKNLPLIDMNPDGSELPKPQAVEPHVVCDGSLCHVLSYTTAGVSCTCENCEVNAKGTESA